MTTYSDYFGVLTYTDPLIYFKLENHSNWMHREGAIKRDVFLKKYIHKLDAHIFQELPIFVPDILGSDTEKKPEPQEDGTLLSLDTEEPEIESQYAHILPEWEREKWSQLLIRMFDAARTHKWCIVQLYSAPPYWRVFTYREVKEIKYDEQDQPISANVMWAKMLPRSSSYNIHKETLNFVDDKAFDKGKDGEPVSQALFINLGTDLDERIESTDIEHIWSLSIYMRYIILDIMNNSAKSSGFYWVKYGSQADDDKKSEIEDVISRANSGRGIGATENLIQDITAMYMAHPEFPVEAFDKILKIFSGACDLPLLYFNGEKEQGSIFAENTGAMEQINDKKKAIFGVFKQAILKLVEMRWGITCEDVFPNIEEQEDEEYYEDIIEPRKPGNGATKDQNVKVQTK